MGKEGRYASLEIAASKATGQDQNSVAALVDEVFKVHHYRGYLPAALQNSLKNRLVDAEMSHRQGAHPGISEEAKVQVVNNVAERLGLPEYAKTNASQVRYLRMHMAITRPIFMGEGMTRPDAKIGDQINSTMSPAQAIHLIQSFGRSKIFQSDLSSVTGRLGPEEYSPTIRGSFRDASLGLITPLCSES
jgi:hypothetical protein